MDLGRIEAFARGLVASSVTGLPRGVAGRFAIEGPDELRSLVGATGGIPDHGSSDDPTDPDRPWA
jgi:hypothetical protein